MPSRPELVTDNRSGIVQSPTLTQVGRAGPVGRCRVIFALPTNKSGPVQLAAGKTLQGDGALVVDPANNVIGVSGPVWVHRMLYARWTENTRRLAG